MDYAYSSILVRRNVARLRGAANLGLLRGPQGSAREVAGPAAQGRQARNRVSGISRIGHPPMGARDRI